MILTMQDMLTAGFNAFGLQLVAKDFARMGGGTKKPVTVALPTRDGTVYVTFSGTPPEEPAPAKAP